MDHVSEASSPVKLETEQRSSSVMSIQLLEEDAVENKKGNIKGVTMHSEAIQDSVHYQQKQSISNYVSRALREAHLQNGEQSPESNCMVPKGNMYTPGQGFPDLEESPNARDGYVQGAQADDCPIASERSEDTGRQSQCQWHWQDPKDFDVKSSGRFVGENQLNVVQGLHAQSAIQKERQDQDHERLLQLFKDLKTSQITYDQAKDEDNGDGEIELPDDPSVQLVHDRPHKASALQIDENVPHLKKLKAPIENQNQDLNDFKKQITSQMQQIMSLLQNGGHKSETQIQPKYAQSEKIQNNNEQHSQNIQQLMSSDQNQIKSMKMQQSRALDASQNMDVLYNKEQSWQKSSQISRESAVSAAISNYSVNLQINSLDLENIRSQLHETRIQNSELRENQTKLVREKMELQAKIAYQNTFIEKMKLDHHSRTQQDQLQINILNQKNQKLKKQLGQQNEQASQITHNMDQSQVSVRNESQMHAIQNLNLQQSKAINQLKGILNQTIGVKLKYEKIIQNMVKDPNTKDRALFHIQNSNSQIEKIEEQKHQKPQQPHQKIENSKQDENLHSSLMSMMKSRGGNEKAQEYQKQQEQLKQQRASFQQKLKEISESGIKQSQRTDSWQEIEAIVPKKD